ncbi:oligosaccharide flippase family protein [Shouchella clausii]|uniref:lipopolysaccharide biosynthesis protein n=1 Tax=Shouchella clausii TaxID=79880 RepID=UPI0031FDA098
MNKIKSLTKSRFIKNVMIMVTGTAAAQAVSMVLSPIITRLYGPEAYGIMGTFMALLTVILPLAALTYPIAIVLPKKDAEAKELIRLSIYVSVIIAVFAAIMISLFDNFIAKLFGLNGLEVLLFLIPISILFSGLLQVTEQWLIRTKQFKITAKVTFLHALISQGGLVGLGFLYPYASILIITQSLREGIKFILMLLSAKNIRGLFKKKGKYNLKQLAKKYYDFPVFRAPEVFLNGLSQSLPILMLTSLFGPASAGFYTICKTVLNLPTQLIGKSVGDVFYPKIAEAANNKEDLGSLILRATMLLAIIGVVPFAIIIIAGPWLFSFVFGPEWLTAGEYARWIAIWSFFGFINRPSVRALPVLSAQAFQLKYTIFMLLVRSIMLFIGYFVFLDDVVAVALFGVSGGLLNVGLILITLRISKKRNEPVNSK